MSRYLVSFSVSCHGRRSFSECSDFTELEVAGVEPITLDDINFHQSYAARDIPRFVDVRYIIY